jgi:hypothetical protein
VGPPLSLSFSQTGAVFFRVEIWGPPMLYKEKRSKQKLIQALVLSRIETYGCLDELKRAASEQKQSGFGIKTVCRGEQPDSWTAVFETGLGFADQEVELYAATKLRRGHAYLSRLAVRGYEITSAAGAFDGEAILFLYAAGMLSQSFEEDAGPRED